MQERKLKDPIRLVTSDVLVNSIVDGLVLLVLDFHRNDRESVEKERKIERCLENAISDWANPQGWDVRFVIARVNRDEYAARVLVSGPPPFPDQEDLLESSNVCDVDEIEISFVPEKKLVL